MKKFLILKGIVIIILMCLIISFFLFFELKPSLEVPDISLDEGLANSVAVFLMNNTSENPFHWKEIVFLGRHYPLTSNGYNHGALEDYLIFPAIKFFGVRLWSLRIIPIFFGMLIIILTYAVGRRLFSPAVGVISSLLLALNPFYILTIKRGPEFGFSLPLFSLTTLLFLWKYLKTGKSRYIYLGMFFLGLGLNAKGFFIWFIIGFLLSILFCYYNALRKINYKVICLAIFAFFIGTLPVIYFYYGSELIHTVVYSSGYITSIGHNNLLILKNFALRLRQLHFVLGGENWEECFSRNIPFFIFCISCLYIINLVIFKKTNPERKQIVHIFLTFLLVASVSVYSFTDLYYTHWYILMPYLQFLIAIAIVKIFKRSNLFSKAFAAACLVTLVAYYSNLCIMKYREFSEEEEDMGSCSVSVLANWLLDNKYSNVTCFDPDTYFGVRIFSNLKICSQDFIFWPWSYDKRNTENNIYCSLHDADSQTIFIMSYSDSQIDTNKYVEAVLERLKKRMFVIRDFIYPNTRKVKFRVFALRD